ncbi:SDR family NAD(P)-dependent oxidoreductase [Brachybacterium vulturis]|uniref:SDR family NAD(P)-dependent oxidoreductase n=1 Tax=Brachybacterium vulturis TaxID=2017484 RepID=UPI003734DB94
MTPRTIILTGASDGIGAAAARLLSPQGHRLLLVGRSPQKIAAVAGETGAEPFVADFASLAEVRKLAERLTDAAGGDGIDVLANNAGGIFGDPRPTVDGFEKTFQVNHLAPFLLTNLLLPGLRRADGSVVNTSSAAHRVFGHLELERLGEVRQVSARRDYGDAKLATVLFTRSLHRRFHDDGLSAVAFHPGVVRTGFAAGSRGGMRMIYHSALGRMLPMISAAQGGANLAWLLEGTPGVTWSSGRYYHRYRPTSRVHPQAEDLDLADALWRRSAEMVGLA